MNTVARIAHDLSLATWFGGSLMGAVGLNGATSKAEDPAERARLSALGWARWAPVQLAAIGVHTVGGAALISGNRQRIAVDPATRNTTIVKAVVTLIAMSATGYCGWLGKKVAEQAQEGAYGATDPSEVASGKVASARNQLHVLQWAIPALTATLVALGAQHGEQQRDLRGQLDV